VDEVPAPNQPIRPPRFIYPVSPRLQRIRSLSRLLDQSIVLPGGYRIGIDPIIGLIPGVGDFIGMSLSFYLVYEAARLGLPGAVLFRMSLNVLLETIIGEIPVLGDIFDAMWKANIRNADLVEKHYNPAHPERSARKIVGMLVLIYISIILLAAAAFIWIISAILSLFR
jgi:hypothetical protein